MRSRDGLRQQPSAHPGGVQSTACCSGKGPEPGAHSHAISSHLDCQLSQMPHNKAACSPHVLFSATGDGKLIGDAPEK